MGLSLGLGSGLGLGLGLGLGVRVTCVWLAEVCAERPSLSYGLAGVGEALA